MKVNEILELTKTKSIGEIAQTHLTISEKEVRLAMKKSGCFKWAHEKTKWQKDDDVPSTKLEQSIYDFL